MSRLQHVNLVQLLGVVQRPFALVLELMDAADLVCARVNLHACFLNASCVYALNVFVYLCFLYCMCKVFCALYERGYSTRHSLSHLRFFCLFFCFAAHAHSSGLERVRLGLRVGALAGHRARHALSALVPAPHCAPRPQVPQCAAA